MQVEETPWRTPVFMLSPVLELFLGGVHLKKFQSGDGFSPSSPNGSVTLFLLKNSGSGSNEARATGRERAQLTLSDQ